MRIISFTIRKSLMDLYVLYVKIFLIFSFYCWMYWKKCGVGRKSLMFLYEICFECNMPVITDNLKNCNVCNYKVLPLSFEVVDLQFVFRPATFCTSISK